MSNVRQWIRQAVNNKYDLEIGSILMLMLITIMSYQVFARTVGLESYWVPEIARLTNVCIVFPLLARLQLENGHIKIDYFYQKFPKKYRRRLDYLTKVLIIGVAIFVAYGSLLYMIRFSHVRTSGAGIPTPLVYLPAFIGFLLYAYVHIGDLVDHSPRLQSIVKGVCGRLGDDS